MTQGSDPLLRRADVPWRNVGPEVLVARADREDFEILRGPAAGVWHVLENPTSIPALVRTLAADYGVDAPTIDAELRGVIVELQAGGLIGVTER